MCPEWTRDFLGAREGIEPPTRGFSAADGLFQGFINQSLAASCRPLPRHTKAQSWHTKSQFDTFLAHREKQAYLAQFLEFTGRMLYLEPVTKEYLVLTRAYRL
jgi:hypothetical protein